MRHIWVNLNQPWLLKITIKILIVEEKLERIKIYWLWLNEIKIGEKWLINIKVFKVFEYLGGWESGADGGGG